MPNHFASIGLGIDGQADLETVVQPLFGLAQENAPASREHRHLLWTDPSGAALAFHINARSELECLAPCFLPPDGGTRWRVRTQEPTPDTGCEHCGGVECDVLSDAGDDMVTRAAVQLIDFVPYRRWLQTERTWELQLAAFAHEIEFFDDEKDYEAWQDQRFGPAKSSDARPFRLAPCCFLASGMFEPTGNMGERACSMLAGTVETCRELRNTATDGTFLSVRIKTLPGSIDVVMPPAMQKGQPLPGNIAMVTGWFIGRPVEPPPAPGRGLLSRLFGRN